jgi:hypothetical protein
MSSEVDRVRERYSEFIPVTSRVPPVLPQAKCKQKLVDKFFWEMEFSGFITLKHGIEEGRAESGSENWYESSQHSSLTVELTSHRP